MNLNKIVLGGRITADPELKQTTGGVPVTAFTVAVNRGKEQVADFIDCTAFNRTAELVSQYFRKGSQIIVVGALRIEAWKDRNGNNRRTARVLVDEVQFVDPKETTSTTSTASVGVAYESTPNEAMPDLFTQMPAEEDPTLPF